MSILKKFLPKIRYAQANNIDNFGYYISPNLIYIIIGPATENKRILFVTLYHEFIHWMIDRIPNKKCVDKLDDIFDSIARLNF